MAQEGAREREGDGMNEAEREANRARECDCPPWYWACAHFDGRVLVLNGWSDAPRCSQCRAPTTIRIWLLYEAGAARCPKCGDWDVGHYVANGDTSKYDALSAFGTAEEALLKGDDLTAFALQDAKP